MNNEKNDLTNLSSREISKLKKDIDKISDIINESKTFIPEYNKKSKQISSLINKVEIFYNNRFVNLRNEINHPSRGLKKTIDKAKKANYEIIENKNTISSSIREFRKEISKLKTIEKSIKNIKEKTDKNDVEIGKSK